jgi:hypothetical protein
MYACSTRTVETLAVRPDADGLRTLVARIARYGEPVSSAIESMTGARFIHDQLELAGPDGQVLNLVRHEGSKEFRLCS